MPTIAKLIEPSATPCLVNPGEASKHWHWVAPALKPAINQTGGRMGLESTFAGLASNAYQLWIAGELAAVTEVRTYPTGLKTVAVLLAGGSAPAPWPEMWEEIERQAKIAGCAKAEMAGRKGWLRVLKGWRQTTIDMEKDLI